MMGWASITALVFFGVIALAYIGMVVYQFSKPCEACGKPFAIVDHGVTYADDEHLPEWRVFVVCKCRWCGERQDYRIG